jgi:calcium/calmodulin-dependent protein kinase I
MLESKLNLKMKSRLGSGKNSSDDLDVPLRHQKQQREMLQLQQKSSKPQPPAYIPAPTVAEPLNNLRLRSVSDGLRRFHGDALSSSPSNPSISPNPLPPLREYDVTPDSVLVPPPSPGTPPKKLWERQYGSFLKNRGKGNRTPNFTKQSIGPSTLLPPKKEKETSVRGGKFFSNVFRQSDSTKVSHRKAKSFSHADELDGTLRRGAEKSYSPANQFSIQSTSSWSANAGNSQSSNSFPAMIRTASPEDYYVKSRLIQQAPPALPFRVDPATSSFRPVSSRAPTQSASSSSGPTVALEEDIGKLSLAADNHLQNAAGYANTNFDFIDKPSDKINIAQLDTSTKTAMKKAFTDFHNSSHDANSAYLGDDPSSQGARSLSWAQKNQRLLQSTDGTMLSSSMSHNSIVSYGALPAPMALTTRRMPSMDLAGRHLPLHPSPLDTVQEVVSIAKSMRILKPIVGAEAWEAGRRYLIAPASLAACPVSAAASLFGNSISSEMISVQEAAAAITSQTASPFETVMLGECLLAYENSGHIQHRAQKQWSSAVLVLRQNYLLEYDPEADVNHSIPRGFAHLHFATTTLHEHFDDTLQLHFFGSPYRSADARTLMIRIMTSPRKQSFEIRGADNLDASDRPEIRKQWKLCLNRGAALTKVSDLYDFDETDGAALLGKSQYVEVRAARRRGFHSSLGNEHCALKIFDKDEFWRMVSRGRERADTLVRETSVQATLTAKCGRINSFLRLRGFFETADKLVLELELLDGTDLFQHVLSNGVLSECEAAQIMRDILRCLQAMNRLGLAHRDIKPANVLMCSSDRSSGSTRVKVGDFGMSAFAGVDGHIRGRCGTPGYVAPEIFTTGLYGGYGNKVDIFSAAVTLYVMLCGYEPFYGETDAELIEANKAALVEFPEEDWCNISSEAKDLVRQMMHVDPSIRLDAKQALEHPWFASHISSELDDSNNANTSSFDMHRTDDACVLS